MHQQLHAAISHFHGDHDPIVDYHQSVLMEAALKKFGMLG